MIDATKRITNETFHAKVVKDEDGFLTVTYKLGLIDRMTTSLVLCMDQKDAKDMIESPRTLLTTIGVKLQNSLIIFATRRLPDFTDKETTLIVLALDINDAEQMLEK